MMKKASFLTLIIFSVFISPFSAQEEDSPWWKKLFKKETVEEIEKDKIENNEGDSTLVISNGNGNDTLIDSLSEIDTSSLHIGPLPKSEIKGVINVYHNFPLDSLNSIYREKEKYGYRIQVYFGELNEAKSTRANFISKRTDDNCYIELRAPNYAVLVGDYRDLFEAHQRLFLVREEYPGAMIVESKIE